MREIKFRAWDEEAGGETGGKGVNEAAEQMFLVSVKLPGTEQYYFAQVACSDFGTPFTAKNLLEDPLWDAFTTRALGEIRKRLALGEIRKRLLETQAPI